MTFDPRTYAVDDRARDGTYVHVRAIRPDDRERLIESFTRLSTASIRARYHASKKGLTAGEVAAETAVDPDVHVGIVTTVWEEGAERIVGLASWFVDPGSAPRTAEAAFTVLDRWQDRGLGTLLFEHLAEVARRCGVAELYADVLADNDRMLGIFERSGLPIRTTRGAGVVRVHLALEG